MNSGLASFFRGNCGPSIIALFAVAIGLLVISLGHFSMLYILIGAFIVMGACAIAATAAAIFVVRKRNSRVPSGSSDIRRNMGK